MTLQRMFGGELTELWRTLGAIDCLLKPGANDAQAVSVIARGAGGNDGEAAVHVARAFRTARPREQENMRANALVQFGLYMRRHGSYSRAVLGMLLIWQSIDYATAELMATAHGTAVSLAMEMALS